MNSHQSVMIKNKKKFHKLTDPKLRRIRYNLRTLLHLEYMKRRKEINDKYDLVAADKSLDYYEKRERKSKILRRREDLNLTYDRSPISCRFCGDRMEDLVFNSKRQGCFCERCNEHGPFYIHEKKKKYAQFIDFLGVDPLAKLMLTSYLIRHSLQELLEMSLKNLQKLFGCNERDSYTIVESAKEFIKSFSNLQKLDEESPTS